MRKTKRLVVDAAQPQPEHIRRAATIINSGGLVAFPTETVYGLGANGLDAQAVGLIFTAKGRRPLNPVILHVNGQEQVDRLVTKVSDTAAVLMEEFWPGALTLLMPRSQIVPDIVTAGKDLVGVRMPDHAVAYELITEAGVPIAAPSANLSGGISPTTAEHVLSDLNGRIDMILDAGKTGLGLESTVLDITPYPPRVLRLGSVTIEQLTRILGVQPVVACSERPDLVRYRGQARLLLVCGNSHEKASLIENMAESETDKGMRVAVLSSFELRSMIEVSGVEIRVMGSENDLGKMGSGLFDLLRDLTARMDVVIVEGIVEQGLGAVIMNRLRDAADKVYEACEKTSTRVLIVCTGNTCRSPMAEYLIADAADNRGIGVQVQSAGIAATVDRSASQTAIRVMEETGFDLSSHRSQRLNAELIDWADVVLVMTRQHQQAVIHDFPDAAAKIFILSEYAEQTIRDVTDPFGGTIEDYRRCRDEIQSLVQGVIKRLHETVGDDR